LRRFRGADSPRSDPMPRRRIVRRDT
jgi:hypothetical protein